MKIFACILSLYVVALTAIPCIDATEDMMLQHTDQTHQTTNEHQNDTGHCSPFCTCYCCASPIIYQACTAYISGILLSQKHHAGYSTACVSSLPDTIWQPPKLS
jgi:hypothetical protein